MHIDHDGSVVTITATVRSAEGDGRTAPLEKSRGNVGEGRGRPRRPALASNVWQHLSVWPLKYSQSLGSICQIDHFCTRIAHSRWNKSRVFLNGKFEALALAPCISFFDFSIGRIWKDRRLGIEEVPADLVVF